ncbi:MAG: hypothetical protein QOI41_3741, partial [Myxococcales bacterium]|nr:hypothetical protein [Myxococcales bacterium]
MVSLAAEFPNDNPELHRGVSWVCLDVTGAPVAILPEPEPIAVAAIEPAVVEPDVVEEAPVPEPRISGIVARGELHDLEDEDDDAGEIVVEELPPLDESASVEGAPMVAAAPAPAPIETIVAPVAATAVATSTALPPASDDAFTVLVSTLADVAIGAGSPYVASLLPALLLEGRLEHAMPADAATALAEADVARGTEVTATFIGQTRAWRALLAGTSDDFAACGNAMLDEWAAELLARL